MNMVLLRTVVLIQTIVSIAAVISNTTRSSYDPAELLAKIFNPNATAESRQRGYGIKFEDDAGINNNQEYGQYGLIGTDQDTRPLRFEDDYDSQKYDPNSDNKQNFDENRPLKFDDSKTNQESNTGISFQDNNNIEGQGNKTKKKRRRRKPKNGVVQNYPGNTGFGRPGFQGPSQGGYGLNPYGLPGYPAVQPFRRPRRPRPRPSIASEALSSITGALTSIALYDDYQCVPRLLCEAAGGGALSDSGALQTIAGIQPLLTLLSAYNGISTSPLFVFGRAVFLGMTSKGNTGTCRYAYPQCPTDPEQLIHYLNNHNGGFFRFFNAPQLPNQNVEQFYNQLSQGNYQPGQNYGHPNPSGQYGFNQGHQGYPGEQNYGLYHPNRPDLYDNQNYGSNYAYDYNYNSGNRIKFQDNNRIQKRIQNKPNQNVIEDSFNDDDVQTKWQFPDDSQQYSSDNIRDSRTLTFPEESYDNHQDSNRKGKHLPNYQNTQNDNEYYKNDKYIFPDNNRYQTTTYSYNNGQYNQNYRPNNYDKNNKHIKYYNYNNTPHNNNQYQTHENYYNNRQNVYNNKYPSTTFNNEEYVFDYQHNFYVKKEKDYVNNYNNNKFKRNEDDGLKTVYVVRGNGDPNKPEIVKLRPGQSVH